MSNSQWYQGIGEAFQGLANGFYFLKEVFNNFLSVLFDYPILTLILGISVFITVCYFAVNFFIDFVNDFDSATETISINSVRQKRYMERQIEREQKAKQRYEERKKQRYPEGDKYNGRLLADLYFDKHKTATYFSYAGKTYYNTRYLDTLYYNPVAIERVLKNRADGSLEWNEDTNSYEVKKKKRLFRRNKNSDT